MINLKHLIKCNASIFLSSTKVELAPMGSNNGTIILDVWDPTLPKVQDSIKA